MKDLISIVVPVYRVEAYLDQCVKSLVSQTYPHIEIILVDDGSPDNSGKMCDEYALKDPRIRVIHQENGGPSLARNTGLDHVTGEYVMFVDSDDWISPDSCEKALAAAREHDVDIVFWSYTREYGDRSLNRYIYGEEQSFAGEAYRQLFLKVLGQTTTPESLDSMSSSCNKLFKVKGIADTVRFVDTKIIGNEDLLYNVRMFSLARNAYYLHETFYHYRKDNVVSYTKSYKKDLLLKRKVLFQTLRETVSGLGDPDCERALSKRVALDILGQCLNVVSSGETRRNKCRFIRDVLRDDTYGPALKQLSTKGMKIHWKTYYGFAKHGRAGFVYLLTRAITVLKKLK